MNVIEMARELGKAIQQDERYIRYMDACTLNDTDTELQNEIGKFNIKRAELGEEMRKNGGDTEKLKELNAEIQEMYKNIMEMPKMVEFYEAKDELGKLITSVNYIVSQASEGEDPETCPETPPQSCSGSCAGCSGCG
ncbi:MAG: YlbF family regulator [Ruminococcus sp.]|nr:YlbF family regulator [Ruminococcus sp.]